MRYLSVCSGIEAATCAWHPLGWEAAAFSEIDKFPRAVLQHHYPDVPLHGDFTTIGGDEYGPIDLLRAASGGSSRAYVVAMAVRRLTPRECERLQGFPDDWTLVPYRGKPAADGPRYKALGNSMAVPCMRWIGERIQMVEGL